MTIFSLKKVVTIQNVKSYFNIEKANVVIEYSD